MKSRILVVDDSAEIRELLVALFEGEVEGDGYEVTEVGDAASLRQNFDGPAPDVTLLDLKLPDAEGLDLLPEIKRQWPDTEVIVLTGHATFDAAVEATKRGAFHFQQKPFDSKTLLITVSRALERKQRHDQASAMFRANWIFHSSPMKTVLRTIERVATSDVPVLVVGESGTGKEVVADLLHTLSPRAQSPLIKINCAALPRELIESELFGSVKGAFTGAHADREGLFRQAANGTLLLDELSEMPVDTQTKLLRVLQEKEFRPVGGRTSYRAECRIIAATNRKVEDAIKDGKLREDLYYRISAITIPLPPLRDRREDILPLATAFLKRFASQAGRNIREFTPAAAERLRRFDWPGNVRQLQNEVQRAVLMCESTYVDAPDLSVSTSSATPEDSASTNLTLMEGVERNAIVQMLKETGGNKLEAAKRLGIGRQTLYNKIKAYGIET